MDDKTQIQLGSEENINSVTVDTYTKVELSNKTAEFASDCKNNLKIGSGNGEILATQINSEFLNTQQDARFLQKLAQKSGGTFFSADSVENLLSSLDLSEKKITVSKTIELWQRLFFLIILIFLLSLEWFIRKRLGLP